ncbi:MAG TPA: DUF6279 family lipoprotein, partial [Halioglobus sp.]
MGTVLRWCRIGVLGALMLVSACSSTTFVYNRLDFLLPWYLSDYVELTQSEKTYFNELLAPFLAWHRSQELPRYVKLLQDIEDELDRPLTPAAVAAVLAEFESAWVRVEGEGLDVLLDLGTRLTEDQITYFIDKLWERQHEDEEKYLKRSDEEFYQDNYDNLRDSAQNYLGRLSDPQRKLLRDSSRQLLRSDHAWLQERAEWFTKLAVLLQRQPGWQQRVREAVVARREDLLPEYRRIYEHNMGVIDDLIAQLLNGRSERQDQHLRNKLSKLRADLK